MRSKTKGPLGGGPSRTSISGDAEIWSGRRGSNPRPRPWQGRALPLSYTRIRDGGDRSPATAQAMPNAARECNSKRTVRVGLNSPISYQIAANRPRTMPDRLMAPKKQGTRRQPAMVSRSDSSHFSNEPCNVPANSSRLPASQSNVAHHSTKALLPSTTGVIRKVAW